MATIPTPRSYEECFGDLADAFLSKTGIDNIKAAGPMMSELEAVAQTQTRGSQDTFQLLRSNDLNNATKGALVNIGVGEGVPPLPEAAASTTVNVGDSSFQKIASTIYAGSPAPIAGTLILKISDASAFPSSGSVYLGRNTPRYEGPLTYSSVINSGSFWTITLSDPTLRFHNLGETVTLAQGGDRVIPPTAIAQTATGDSSSSVQFKVRNQAKILDGEVLVTGVLVNALKTGVAGNVGVGAINSWVSAPFTGATVSNPNIVSSGRASEQDDDYRDRIRAKRASRQGGTRLALTTAAVDVVAPDEPKRSVSAALASEGGGAFTLYVDDGTGYEEVDSGIAIEPLVDEAFGGERERALSRFPVAKPQLLAAVQAPYVLFAGGRLAFEVDGQITEHAFSAADARSIGSASAHDAVASVNADPNLNWSMRTAQGGATVASFPRARKASSIRLAAASANDVSGAFLFPTTASYDVRLYEDDLPLNEFGSVARVLSRPFADWAGLSGPQTLIIVVDGTVLSFDGSQFPSFASADFVAAATGYSSVGPNSPAAWAAVFNRRIPGIAASVQGGLLALDSNRGNSPFASVQILGGTLAAGGMFSIMTNPATGSTSDFSLDRNTGEVVLARPLVAGQTLSAGSAATRAFLQSPALMPVTLGADGHLWFSVDGMAELPSSGLSATTGLDVTSTAQGTHFRVRLTSHAASALFAEISAGDQAVFWDAALIGLGLSGTYRVSRVDAGGTWFEVVSAGAVTPATNLLPAQLGLQFGRASRLLRAATVTAGTGYTATSFAAALAIPGATASTRRTNQLRLTADTSDLTGSIALIAADGAGRSLGLPRASVPNRVGHVASIESAGSEAGYPDFHQAYFTGLAFGDNEFIWSSQPDALEAAPSLDGPVLGLRSVWPSTSISEWGNNQDFSSYSEVFTVPPSPVTGGNVFRMTQRSAPEVAWVPLDRATFCRPFQLSYDDQLAILVDEDAVSGRFLLPAARRVRPTTSTYGSSNFFTDLDNGGAALGAAFGSSFDFDDWAVYMPARTITDAADATRSVLWRWYRPGPDGEQARVAYGLPSVPNQGPSVAVDDLADDDLIDVTVTLASGAATTGISVRPFTRVGVAVTAVAAGVSVVCYVLGFPIASAARTSNADTLTLGLPGGVTDHGIPPGAVVYVASTNVNFASGTYTVASATATTITYSETGANIGSTLNIGTASYDVQEATMAFASPGVAPGQFFQVTEASSVPAPFSGRTTRISGNGPQFVVGHEDGYGGSPFTVVQWYPLNSADAWEVFANPAQSTADVIAAVNALTASSGGGSVPIKGTVTGTGSGIQDRPSFERAGASPAWAQLVDGINYVDLTTSASSPTNYQLSFKTAPSSGLATGSDWANETCYLVPRSAKNVADWASCPAFSGLFTSAEVKRSSGARRLQLSSLTPGTAGSIRCQGGTANEAALPLVGSQAGSNGTRPTFQVPSALLGGVHGGQLVLLENASLTPKQSFGAGTVVGSISVASGLASVVLGGGGTACWTNAGSPSPNAALLIEKSGEAGSLVMLSDTGLGSTLTVGGSEGDWVRITTPAAPALSADLRVLAQNTGIFRVVRVVSTAVDGRGGSFWVENAGFAAQGTAECDVQFLAADSLVPGDGVAVGTAALGAANQGQWTVASVGDAGSGPYTNRFAFALDATSRSAAPFTGPLTLGASSALVRAYDAAPARSFKRLLSACPSPTDPSLVDLKFASGALASRFGAAWGTTVQALNKLGFPSGASFGLDGYRYQVGLLGEVARVLYGDPSDPATYPGVAGAGAQVDLAGPNVRRVQVSVQVRLSAGAVRAEVAAAVRQAVARSINQTLTGRPVAIEAYLAAGERVSGAEAIAPISPALTAGGSGDVISVQPNEKAMVLDPDQDVTVAFAGD